MARRIKILTSLGVALIALVALSFILIGFSLPQVAPSNNVEPDSRVKVTEDTFKSLPKVPVIIYGEKIAETEFENRSYPTIKIMRKIGAQAPEELAIVGKGGEYPTEFTLSPDKKTLLVNLRTKLLALDIQAKTLTTLFTTSDNISGTVYSPDGKKIALLELQGNDYVLHEIDPRTKERTVLSEGSRPLYGYLMSWRKDNNLLISETGGEHGLVWYYDKVKNTMHDTKYVIGLGTQIDATGYFMNKETKSVDYVCDIFGGDVESEFMLLDPVTQKTYGTIGGQNKGVHIENYSKDGQYVMYSEFVPTQNEADCDKAESRTYYTARVSDGGDVTKIDDPVKQLAEWGVDDTGADFASHEIALSNKILVRSNNFLRWIADYWQ